MPKKKPYDVLVFIGRFQPFHRGHKAVVDAALLRADKVALVIGSHDQPRSTRNPFTTSERIKMISQVYSREIDSGRLHFIPQIDHTYNLDRWIAGIQTGVHSVAYTPWTPDPVKIGLIGHSKDSSSFYLKCFPTWGNVEVANVAGLNATDIRTKLLKNIYDFTFFADVPGNGFLTAQWREQHLGDVMRENAFIEEYKKQWKDSPYPPTFVTVDAVVVQSGHVLLVRRKASPGKGLWALPGGFIGADETLENAAVRELREETRIDVPLLALRGSISGYRTFDDPYRSQRGRTITTAFYFRLSDRETLPKIKGSDDADKARWVPLSEVRRNEMFEDHYDIIETMVSI